MNWRGVLVLAGLLVSTQAFSEEEILWQPEVATVPSEIAELELQYQQQTDSLVLASPLVEVYLNFIRRSDSHDLLQRAKEVQSTASEHPDASENIPWLLASADLYQYQHNFNDARVLLLQVLELDSSHLRASLMLARIALAQGLEEEARTTCSELFGDHALGVVLTCLLEVEGRGDYPQQAYNQLKQLQQRSNSSADSHIRHWRLQILAEQALLLELYSETRQWLAQLPQPLSIVERKLLLDSYLFDESSSVPQELIPSCEAQEVDAIAIRLARAQQGSNETCWSDYAQERIQIREIRGDRLHSADIAYYYTYVKPQPEMAFRWANINYSVAKEPLDEILLMDARNLGSQSSDFGG
ncbi:MULTISPECIES: tetratricopeptide repeat protein [Gammaproteobacteria]|uniref:tetratricopeptide repeat protein n=1 Tax=Gammaproteobacteria TaxID=1236 RepID=UPI000DD048EF|nr:MULTISPECIES: tetratricopeptide repeat protein [Gammaproteobacteria]RTE86587.1 hypothetical protein DQX04_08515 [Aliidiomarina sp. B3213]TCZ90858.1 hypothetical protein EYQ95_08530 [Lysobacter sp. N42]